MATVKQNTSATAFNGSQIVRRATAQIVRSLEGTTIDRFEVHMDLVGDWQDADPNKTYAGLVPVIGGTARYDLALLSGDLMAENLPSYPSGDDVQFVTPDDDLHKVARAYLASNQSATYDAWLNHVATQCAGYVVAGFSYPARTKRGGKWQNCLFGANKKA
jgi:hypothetical protein